jgi:DNA-binding XRE family transcriptional regulator
MNVAKPRNKRLGTAIRCIRKRLLLCQASFGVSFGVRRNTVVRWESGSVVPRPGLLLSLLGLALGAEESGPIRDALLVARIPAEIVDLPSMSTVLGGGIPISMSENQVFSDKGNS